ncbi:hypothetical protein SAMN04490248_11145 [Salinihabitans flavidus]|uniref:PH domain-containing protein n=1 Tax=Salinihabitans flavidus TaxID=569882 RepID=A0A1H8S9V7_9RHOB|nr:hypothetical protein [Salinihabitans flavidus]SEO74953.1 hypothetical protein SAMN04490248_11145 [Salinihabitans flavidus]
MTDPTPLPDLTEGEEHLATFAPDPGAYLRGNAWMAAAAMAGGMAVLWALGNPHAWTGAVGGLAAVGLRAAYMRSEEMAAHWHLTSARLLGPQGRSVRLGEIKALNILGPVVQIVTLSGDKHLIKYQPDTAATIAAIRRAQSGGRP